MNLPLISDIAKLKERTASFSPLLYEARRRKNDASKLVKDAQGAVTDSEREVAYMVSQETEQETAKKLFGNETDRKNATAVRLKNNARHQALLKELDVAERELFNATNELQKTEDEERAIRGIAGLIHDEVLLLTHTQ